MPDFVVSTKLNTREDVSPAMDKASRSVRMFERTANKSFDKASDSVRDFSVDALRSINRMEDRLSRVSVTRGVLGADLIREGFVRAREEVFSFVTEAAKVESAEASFRPLLGSLEAAKETVAELRLLGARTPFTFGELTPTTRLLLGFEAATRETLIPTLSMLGDLSAGNADALQRIGLAFGQVQAAGKASMQDVNQFINAGIPILKELARQWGVTTAQARKMVSQGKATGEEVTKAFKNMTSEGGRFFKGMEFASQTFEGRMSTLRDEVDLTKSTIGLGLLPVLKEYVDAGIKIAQSAAEWAKANEALVREEVILWFETGKEVLKAFIPVLTTAFGLMRELLPVVRELAPILPILAAGWAANKVAMIGLGLIGFVRGFVALTTAIRAAGSAQAFFNLMMAANPIGLVIAGVTGLAAGIWLLAKNWDTVVESMLVGIEVVLTRLKEDFFSTIRFGTLLFRMLARETFDLISKGASLVGFEKVEREFGNLVKTMDELDFRLKEASGVLPWWQERGVLDNLAKLNNFQFAGVMPVKLSLVTDETGLGVSDGLKVRETLSTGNLGLGRNRALSNAFAGRGLGVARDRLLQFQVSGFENAPDAGEGFNVAGGVTRSEKIEHVVKLDITGAPEGAQVQVVGGSSPPIAVNLLGG